MAGVILVKDKVVFVNRVRIPNASCFIFMRYLPSAKIFISVMLWDLSGNSQSLLVILELVLLEFGFEALFSDIGSLSSPTFFLCFNY